ncbi:uncharacterized protein LOC120906450 [Anopheles arabiensis]|uniref:Uncharacterized protein n=1 Tax=Anopheles arabiensis TaxID=7173 RepID=A0A182IA33_ANOAR|nr:uncharacterized protein LOC120906450 [Anopheles arabiensis]
MNKLLTGGLLFLLVAGSLVSGSMFGPFGPFGPAAQLPGAVGGYPGAVGGYPGAVGGLPMYPGRPGVGQLPMYPPLYPAAPMLPPTPAMPYAYGRAMPAMMPVAPPPAANLRTVASNTDVLGRLAVADLPEDLQQRAQDMQAASEQGFDACEQMLTTTGSYWQYKRCNALQLRTVLTAAKALEQEATARSAAAAAAAAATPAAAGEQVAVPAQA